MIDEKKLIEDIHGYFRKDMEKYLPEDKGDVVVGENLEKCKELLRLNKVIYDIIENQPKVSEWIPFEEREMDAEEKEAHPGECYTILCCNLPDDGEEILVSYKGGRVGTDYYYADYDGCYLDSNCEFITEAVAWMPLPDPYREDGV